MAYDPANSAAVTRDQPIDIIDFDSGQKICTVTAGPRTDIETVKKQLETSTGVPVSHQRIHDGEKRYKDVEHIGMGIFKEAQNAQSSPQLQLKKLSDQEAAIEHGRANAIDAILHHGDKLHHLEEAMRSDPEVVLLAVEHCNASELQHAGDNVKADKDSMLEALKLSPQCMYYVAENLWQDRTFVESALTIDGMFLGQRMVPEKWRSDPEAVMLACEANGFALKFASEELKNNRSVVFAAVSQRGTALMYASEELRGDYYIVLDAVRQNKMAIVHALGGLREDDDIRAAAGQGPSDVKMLEKIDKIKKKFHELDENGDGFLSYEELFGLLKKGNPDLDEDEIRLLYDGMDTHQDGRVDFHEFCDYIFSED